MSSLTGSGVGGVDGVGDDGGGESPRGGVPNRSQSYRTCSHRHLFNKMNRLLR